MISISETDDPIDIRLDNVFKAVFTKDTPESRDALSQLLSAVTGRPLTVMAITANEPPADSVRDRQIRFDLNCMTEEGSYVNVEMSLNPDIFEPVRLEFHAGKLFTGQDIRGSNKTYDDLKEAYQIAILAKGQFFADGAFIHDFEYYDKERKMALGGRTRIITQELSKLEYLTGKAVGEMSAVERWGFYFKYLTDREKRQKINEIIAAEEGIAMASEVLMRISRNDEERLRLASELKYELDTQSRIEHARREGQQDGRRDSQMETAKNLKAMGITIEQINRATGLSTDEIAKL